MRGQAARPAAGWRRWTACDTPFAKFAVRWQTIRQHGRAACGPPALLAVAVAGIATTVYMTTAAQRNISTLIEEGEYQQAAVAANAYLETHRNDRDVGELATEAMLKATAPDWTRLVMSGDFAAARDTLESARHWSTNNASAAPLIDSMQWVTDMEQFITERGGPDAPIVMFEQEDKVNALLDWWETDPNAHHRSLGTIVREVPGFAELRSLAFSHQRALQSHKDAGVRRRSTGCARRWMTSSRRTGPRS